MATSFNVNQADLAFILKQIQIAELHAGGMPLIQAIQTVYPGLSASDAAISPFGLRTVDGQDNNLLPGNSQYGAANTLFPRLTNPVFLNDTDSDVMPLGPVGSGAPTITNNNYGVAGSVADADPRIISNLVVSMTADNPAAIDAYLSNPLSLAQFEADHPGMTPVAPTDIRAGTNNYLAITNADIATIPNQSPDIGLSPGFNSWMTFFGQFFDHGLDLVTKGSNGTVYIPLQVDDPLYDKGVDGIAGTADDGPNFMALTRATVTLDANGVPQTENTTTAFVDQNQTYTSDSSHQVFLREYVKDANGNAVSTGHLLDGTKVGSIANWGEVKAQAIAMLGIKLDDFDVHNVPLLETDQYGKFIPGTNGYAKVTVNVSIVDATTGLSVNDVGNVFVEGVAGGLDIHNLTTANLPGTFALPGLGANEAYKVSTVGTNHAFLNDIAHHAAPSFVDDDHNPATPKIRQVADSDNLVGDDGDPLTYDNEMLDAHFLTGDGRGNENIALTSVHSIFHSEHNRLVEANKDTLIASGDAAVVNEWLLSGAGNQITQTQLDSINALTNPVAKAAAIDVLSWNGERLFQAGRFVTEMQYQHLVFEEFARRIQPNVAPFVFTNTPTLDASILAEFAHVVYRFGHSMLTGTVDRLENDLTTVGGTTDQATLLAAFLNPQMYLAGGQTIAEINANLIRGLTRDVGNEIDEFIVQDVRSNLLGLPLDLAALNIARGRDTGIGSLNTVRTQLYNDFGSTDLKPYTSWTDFAQNLKNPTSVVNFIAAYGTHSSILGATTLVDKRNAAMLLVFGGTGAPSDRLDFMNATNAFSGGSLGGLNSVDLWVGGLAEAKKEFGGMLGSTFNFIFQYQMEHLQNGDRLYYLSRTQGTNLLNQLEPNTFTDLVMRNTDLGGIYSTHLNGSLFASPDRIYELDNGIAQVDYDPTLLGRDEEWSSPTQQAINPKVVRTYTGATTTTDSNGVVHDVGGYFKFSGGEHVVLGGTEGNDTLLSDKGIDTLWGDGGNDYLNAGSESDNVFGGEGDDIIVDPFGDDLLRGNQGNDVISGGVGLDILFGDQGSDYIITGTDATEVFAGQDNDFILGNGGGDNLLGNEGDDWLEGGEGFDTLTGENSELFFNSPIVGHDVLWGQGNDTDYDGESGDDIMFSGPGIQRNEGMYGFDWGIAKFDPTGVNFNLALGVAFPNVIGGVLRDRFDFVEAVSGWKNNDTLEGDERGRTVIDPVTLLSIADPLFNNDILTAEGIDRINGFRSWFGFGNVSNPTVLDTIVATGVLGATATSYRNGNIILGGDGNDRLQGRGGFDLLDGDSWLNVRIKIDMGTAGFYYAESLNPDINVVNGDPLANAGKVTNASGAVQFGGKSLNLLMLDRTLNPGQLSIVREIVKSNIGGVDTAVFRGTQAQYTIEGRVTNALGGLITQAHDANGDGFISVTHNANGIDDTDYLKNIELLEFTDGTINIRLAPPVAPTDIRWNGVTPTNALPVANTVIANLSTTDADTTSGFVYALAAGSSAGFTVSSAGVVTRTAAMIAGQTYVLNISSTDTTGGTRTETFTVRTGTTGIDTITADSTDNTIYGFNNNDTLNGFGGDDNLYGQAGNDTLNGGIGNDILVGGAGADTVNGDAGNDIIRYAIGDGADIVNGGADVDTLAITGAAANDALAVTFNGTVITNFAGGTVVGVESVTADLGAGTDTLTYTAPGGVTVNLALGTASGFTSIANIENVTGGAGADLLTGNIGANTMTGGAGADIINGGDGSDILIGGTGADLLTGGLGNDIFRYTTIGELTTVVATSDRITDFTAGDIIDLAGIDANTGAGGNQTFAFIGNAVSFGSAAQVRYFDNGVDTFIALNTNNSIPAEAILTLSGVHTLTAANFVL
jgi:Ca2+-binding RTX toxin-like protein